MGNALVNTIRAKGAIQPAVEEDIRYIAHGNNNSNEYMIFELNCYALNPSIKIIAAQQKPEVFTKLGDSRNMLQYVKEKGIRVLFISASPCSVDANLIQLRYLNGLLENPQYQAPESLISSYSH